MSVKAIQSFMKARNHRHEKNRCRQNAHQEQLLVHLALTTKDVRISPQASRRVEITLLKGGRNQWVIKRNLIPNSPSTYFLVPNMLIEAEKTAMVYVTNPMDMPQILQRGDVIRTFHEVKEYFDSPISKLQREEMEKTALLMEKLLHKEVGKDDSESANDEEGPETADLPDPNEYPSSQLRDLLDVGDLPMLLQENAWLMLSRHIKAFGFNGKLGNYPAKARIRTVEGASPVSLPMYALSLTKRQFIDQQIDTWYVKGIIEPSKSPLICRLCVHTWIL